MAHTKRKKSNDLEISFQELFQNKYKNQLISKERREEVIFKIGQSEKIKERKEKQVPKNYCKILIINGR